jgi:prepilin peptidase CpaA
VLFNFLGDASAWLNSRWSLALLLILTLWIAWGDVRTRRIPNYLTLGIVFTGLAYQLGFHGWPGLLEGFLGMLLGFALLILPYIWGGMGAGDVKALAALGTWLGPWRTTYLFCYMGLAGGLLAIATLWWKGLLRIKLRQGWGFFLNWILSRPHGQGPTLAITSETRGIPYGVAIALGMAILICRGE